MSVTSLPPVPHDITADRPDWPDLPAAVRAAIEERLGGPVTAARVARGGFTRGFAALLSGPERGPADPEPGPADPEPGPADPEPGPADAEPGPADAEPGPAGPERVFVKASDIDYLVDAYQREAVITAALPYAVPAARPRWTATAAGWYILALDPIDGQMPRMPWTMDTLSAALDAWAMAASALRESFVVPYPLPSFPEVVREDMMTWRDIAAHRAPVPAMPRYLLPHLDELARLEDRLAELSTSDGIMHCDLRLDNVLVSPPERGVRRAWLCDWNWVCRGPAWFDTMSLLVTAYASGLDASGLFAGHPTAVGVPDDALDAGLAGLGGLWLRRAGLPSDASRSLAGHQRWSGEMAMSWLAHRRGWT